MTEKEARNKTKYFRAGVSAGVWCYAGDGDWEIKVTRGGGRCWFPEIDGLKRRLWNLREQIERGEKEPTLMSWNGQYQEDEIQFVSIDDANECIAAIAEALIFVRANTQKHDWCDVPASVFEPAHPLVDQVRDAEPDAPTMEMLPKLIACAVADAQVRK